MKVTLQHGVLHLELTKDSSELPESVLTVLDAYEGTRKGRLGWNVPMSFVKSRFPKHPFFSPYFVTAAYVIVYKKGDILTKKHELQHAKYYMDPVFQKEVVALWNSFSPTAKEKITAMLMKMKYAEEVLLDEFQAYYYTEKAGFFPSVHSISGPPSALGPHSAHRS